MTLERSGFETYELTDRPNWRGLDVTLTPQQELACACRILARADCNLDVTGHITMVADERGSMYCNPYGMWWEEVRASDVLLVDPDGNQLAGSWGVNPAIFIHTEVHRRGGPAAKVIVHNHPYYGVLLGTIGVVPEITDQQSCLFKDDVGVLDQYSGGVLDLADGVAFADGVADKSAVLLAGHGCLVSAASIQQAAYKTVMFERMCRLNFDALAAGMKARPLPEAPQSFIKGHLLRYSSHVFWEGAVRQLLVTQPDVMG